MRKTLIAAAVAGVMTAPHLAEPYPPRKSKKAKCCGKDHAHNNSFCSSKCCKEYQEGADHE